MKQKMMFFARGTPCGSGAGEPEPGDAKPAYAGSAIKPESASIPNAHDAARSASRRDGAAAPPSAGIRPGQPQSERARIALDMLALRPNRPVPLSATRREPAALLPLVASNILP